MIYVLERLSGAEPRAWFAFDDSDLLQKVAALYERPGRVVWDCATARELLESVNESPTAGGVSSRFPALWELGAREGWDRPLYRADALMGVGVFVREPVAVRAACVAALQAVRGDEEVRVFADESVAVLAVEASDPWFEGPGGWRLRHALRQQLVATEALADDV